MLRRIKYLLLLMGLSYDADSRVTAGVQVGFGLFLIYYIGYVDGLFGANPTDSSPDATRM